MRRQAGGLTSTRKCAREKYGSFFGSRKWAFRPRPTMNVSCSSKPNSCPSCGPPVTFSVILMAVSPAHAGHTSSVNIDKQLLRRCPPVTEDRRVIRETSRPHGPKPSSAEFDQGRTLLANWFFGARVESGGSRSRGSSRWTPRRSAARRGSVLCRVKLGGRPDDSGPRVSSGNGSWKSASRRSTSGWRRVNDGSWNRFGS